MRSGSIERVDRTNKLKYAIRAYVFKEWIYKNAFLLFSYSIINL